MAHNYSKGQEMNSSLRFQSNSPNSSLSKFLIIGGWTILFTSVLFFLTKKWHNIPNALTNTTFLTRNPKNKNGSSDFLGETPILYNPEIPNSTTYIMVDENKPFSLNCPVDNLPEPIALIWKKFVNNWTNQVEGTHPDKTTVIAISSNIITQEYKERSSVLANSQGSRLTINVANMSDSGTYECSFAIPDSSPSIKYEIEVVNE